MSRHEYTFLRADEPQGERWSRIVFIIDEYERTLTVVHETSGRRDAYAHAVPKGGTSVGWMLGRIPLGALLVSLSIPRSVCLPCEYSRRVERDIGDALNKYQSGDKGGSQQ